MSIDVIGISGSPRKNSNTDRLINTILESTGVESEFVKLSMISVRPCLGCFKCVKDNVCKEEDDFPALAEKIKKAKALVIGGYTPYSQIDGFTKALLERFWSLRHQTNLLKGKMVATILTGISPEAQTGVNQSLAMEMENYENMELLGQLSVQGNVPCSFCGVGDKCKMSAFNLGMFDPGTKTSDIEYNRVEDQEVVYEKARVIGRLMGKRLKN